MNIVGQNKNIVLIALAVALILLVPYIAMQLSDEVAWSLLDFAFAGALLFGTGLAFELVTRKARSITYRVAVGMTLLAAMLLVWINLAVGIIGSEDNPANMMYSGVIAILIIGAMVARLQPRGMVRALFATALAQVVVSVMALAIWRTDITSAGGLLEVMKVAGVNMLFVGMWVSSALLFHRAYITKNLWSE